MCRKPLLILAAMLLLPAAICAQTVDEIIAKNIQAHGGMDKLKSVSSRTESAKFSAGSFKADVRLVNKRPGHVRMEFIIQGMAQVRAYDGKAGWQVNPFSGRREAELLSEDDMKDLVVEGDIDGPLVDYKQKGHTAELMGHDSVEGTDCYKVQLTLKNGDIRTYYLDTDSYLELKLETRTFIRGAPQESETYYGDYEQIGGMYFPFAIEQGQKGNPERVNLTVEKVEINPQADDALFTMPAAKPAAGSPGTPK